MSQKMVISLHESLIIEFAFPSNRRRRFYFLGEKIRERLVFLFFLFLLPEAEVIQHWPRRVSAFTSGQEVSRSDELNAPFVHLLYSHITG